VTIGRLNRLGLKLRERDRDVLHAIGEVVAIHRHDCLSFVAPESVVRQMPLNGPHATSLSGPQVPPVGSRVFQTTRPDAFLWRGDMFRSTVDMTLQIISGCPAPPHIAEFPALCIRLLEVAYR